MTNSRSRTNTFSHILGFVLMVVAGWIDTVALNYFVNENSSFLTGRVVKLGKYILIGNHTGIKSVLLIIFLYIAGAVFSTLITRRAGLSWGLYFSGSLLLLSLIVFYLAGASIIAYICLPMCMGSQNAATSLTRIGRTTHLTGPITDIGIYIAKGEWKQALFWVLRAIGFLLGALVAYYLTGIYNSAHIPLFKTLIAPTAILFVVAFLQKRFIKLELLEN